MTMTWRRLLAAAAIGLLLAQAATTVHLGTAIPASASTAPAAARAAPPAGAAQAGERSPYIVQAASVDVARSAVLKVGGVVTGDLSIIRAVGASLNDDQVARRVAVERDLYPGKRLHLE